MNEKRSHLLRRGEWADKTAGLALPIAPFLRDKKGWTTQNRSKKRRLKSLVRRRSLKENKKKKRAKRESKAKPTRVAGLKQPQRDIKALDTRTEGTTKLVKKGLTTIKKKKTKKKYTRLTLIANQQWLRKKYNFFESDHAGHN